MSIAIFAALSTSMTVIFTHTFFYIFPDMINSMNFDIILLILLVTFYSIFIFSYSRIMEYIER